MTNLRRMLAGVALCATFAVGFGAHALASANTGNRIRFHASNGQTIVVIDPRDGYLSAEDVSTLKLVDYDSTTRAVYRVVYP